LSSVLSAQKRDDPLDCRGFIVIGEKFEIVDSAFFKEFLGFSRVVDNRSDREFAELSVAVFSKREKRALAQVVAIIDNHRDNLMIVAYLHKTASDRKAEIRNNEHERRFACHSEQLHQNGRDIGPKGDFFLIDLSESIFIL